MVTVWNWLAVVVLLIIAVSFAYLLLRGLAKGPRGRGEVSDRWLAVALCSACAQEYETEWIPGVSFRALRMGLDRYQKCPRCGRLAWARFERWAPTSGAGAVR